MRYLIILSLILLPILLSKGWYKLTDGFKVAKIIPSQEIFFKWEDIKEEKIEPAVEKILSQPFHYLGRGQQCYAFESEDKKYVMKILRLHKYRIPFWCALFPQKELMEHRKKSWENTNHSFEIAFTHLRDESGLIYLHNAVTCKLPMLTLLDKLGRKSEIDSNHLFFLLQKKAEPILNVAGSWSRGEVISFIDHYLTTLKKRIAKNIRNKNRNVMKNLGTIGKEVIEFDVGEFRFHPTSADSASRRIEMQKSTKKLRKWLSQKDPSLLSYLDEQIEKNS